MNFYLSKKKFLYFLEVWKMLFHISGVVLTQNFANKESFLLLRFNFCSYKTNENFKFYLISIFESFFHRRKIMRE